MDMFNVCCFTYNIAIYILCIRRHCQQCCFNIITKYHIRK